MGTAAWKYTHDDSCRSTPQKVAVQVLLIGLVALAAWLAIVITAIAMCRAAGAADDARDRLARSRHVGPSDREGQRSRAA